MKTELLGNWVSQRAGVEVLRVLKQRRSMNKMKWLVAGAILFLLLGIGLWPQFQADDRRLSLTFDSIEQVGEEHPIMSNPRFFGVDKKDQPFNVTAKRAIQKSENQALLDEVAADITTESGTWMHLKAKEGSYNYEQETLDLKGDIRLFTSDGYEVMTEAAYVDFAHSVTTGNALVRLQGPLGVLQSDGFMLENDGAKLLFYGKVYTRIYPGNAE